MPRNDRTRSLVITDTPQNIQKLAEFLKEIPAIREPYVPLRTEIFNLQPEHAKKIYNILNLMLYEEPTAREFAVEGRKLLLDESTNVLIVRDTDENLQRVYEVLNDEALLQKLAKEELIAKFVGLVQSPLYGLVNVLSGNLRSFVCVLQARAKQLEEGG